MTIRPLARDLLVHECPFCRSFLILISNTHTAHYTAHYTTSCEDCGARISGASFDKRWKTSAKQVADHLTAIRDAVRRWNTRGFNVYEELRPALLKSHIHTGEGKTFKNLGGTFGRACDEDEGT